MGISTWKKKPLKELCIRVGDGLHGTPKYSDSSKIAFINGNNLKNGHIVFTENTKYVTKEEYDKNFIKLNSFSLLMSINGTLGAMAFYDGEKIMLGKSAAYLNFKTDINRFQYYYFQLPSVQNYFYNVATGSTIKNLSLKSIQDFEVPVPEINEYKQIAKVLSDLDAKIEVNNKINQELEAMAKTLYDYWFVQFDFPDANGKPYKASGGNMVYNEALKREIPEGWKVKEINKVVKVKDGTHDSPKSIDKGFKLITSKHLKLEGLDFDSANSISEEDYTNINKRSQVDTGDILFSMIGNIGTVYKVEEKTIDFAIKNVALYKTSEHQNVKNYLYMYLRGFDMQRYMGNVIAGSIQKFIGLGSLRKMPFLIDEKSISNFEAKTKAIFNQINTLKLENQKLSELRDWLLPMLMNGQVTVSSLRDFEPVLSENEVKQSYEVNTKSELGKVAEPGAAYEKDKESIDSLFDTINYDYEVAVVVFLTRKQLDRTYGKKYIHKMFSNIKFLEDLPVFEDLKFEENGWGMYCPILAKTIENQRFIYFEGVNDDISVINFNYKHIKEVSDWMKLDDDYNKNFVNQVNNMLSIYEKPLINKNMDRIELLNTVLECMNVLETDNFEIIWKKMERWKMQEDNYKTKSEKFREDETRMMIDFIKGLK